MNYYNQNEFENCTVQELEHLAIHECNEERRRKILKERQGKINYKFDWTAENKEKLLYLDKMILDCLEKVRKEAGPIIQEFQKRSDNEDPFLHEFRIEVVLSPYFFEESEEYGGKVETSDEFESLLMIDWEEKELTFKIYNIDAVFFDVWFQNLNWNIEPHFQGKFEDSFISQAMHNILRPYTLEFFRYAKNKPFRGKSKN